MTGGVSSPSTMSRENPSRRSTFAVWSRSAAMSRSNAASSWMATGNFWAAKLSRRPFHAFTEASKSSTPQSLHKLVEAGPPTTIAAVMEVPVFSSAMRCASLRILVPGAVLTMFFILGPPGRRLSSPLKYERSSFFP